VSDVRICFLPLLALALWLGFIVAMIAMASRERRIAGHDGGISCIELLIVAPPGTFVAICLNAFIPPCGDILSLVFIASVVIATALGIRNARPLHPGIPRARVVRR
jgi:hypothetical protein